MILVQLNQEERDGSGT